MFCNNSDIHWSWFLNVLQKNWCDKYWNGLIRFFTPENMCIDSKIILVPCAVTEILTNMRFSVMAALIWLFCTKYWCGLYWNSLVWIFTPQNMGIDTEIILIPCIVTEILMKTKLFSVMASLICILCRLPKDDRVASVRFLNSTYQRCRLLHGKTIVKCWSEISSNSHSQESELGPLLVGAGPLL